MSKFALLILFLSFIIYWMNQPVVYNPSDQMINKHRPSYQYSPDAVLKDSIKAQSSSWTKNPTAYYAPNFKPK